MKIILLFCGPLSNLWSSKLQLEFFENNGFEINYWNLSNFFFDKKELSNHYKGNPLYESQFKNEIIFYKKRDFKIKLKSLYRSKERLIFWCYDLNNFNDFWIRNLFKKYNINYFVGPKRTPYINYLIDKTKFKKYSFLRVLKAIKRRVSFNYLSKNLLFNFFTRTNFYKHPLFILGSGKLGEKIYKKQFPRSEFIHVPSFDLDWSDLNSKKDDYCVYVDDAVDYGVITPWYKSYSTKYHSYYACKDLDKFYYNLRSFFDKIENLFKKKVIVAAMGKYLHSNSKKFGDREIIYYQTNKLIKKSKIVIGHESSGLWQSIISNKKVIILDDPTFTNQKKENVKKMAYFMNLKVFDQTKITKKILLEYFDNYNFNYENLIRDYFSLFSKTDDYKDILLRRLKEIKNQSIR